MLLLYSTKLCQLPAGTALQTQASLLYSVQTSGFSDLNLIKFEVNLNKLILV